MGINIIFEDKDIIVLDKEPGVSIQDSTNRLSLDEEVKAHIKQRDSKPGNVFLGIVHRLDTNVGGLIVFAKNSKSAAHISEQIRIRTFKKYYVLVTDKALSKPSGSMEDYLEKDEKELKSVVKAIDEEGVQLKPNAFLKYELVSENNGLFMYKVELQSGKFHQIRSQFSHRGSPLLGDLKYGSRVKLQRDIALFAYELSFTHPREKNQVTLSIIPEGYPWSIFATSLKSL
jgi:23S rRNA pseudouridine1911/1915/1917 synthase